jgi:4-hydroxy-2-oxoheptanedioate aldolase
MRLGQRDRRYAARRADYQTMVQCFPAMERLPVTKLVQVPWNEPGIISKVPDGGAYGVIWPMVNPREERWRSFPTAAVCQRGSAAMGRSAPPCMAWRATIKKTANDEILVIPMIEMPPA